MTTAYVSVKKHIFPRQDAFLRGFAAAGYSVVDRDPVVAAVRPGDVYAIWNRRGAQEPIADAVERAGGSVIVAENGYLGKDEGGAQHLAVARHGHNGSGDPLIPHDPARWGRLGIEPRPWRAEGDYILVCPNRFIAPRWFLMPPDWVERTVSILRRHTDRPIRVRPHPGHWKRLAEHPAVSLARDLERALACVVWSSTAAAHALLAGVPVICTAPFSIVRSACETDLLNIDSPRMGDRRAAFELLARSQFTLAEIASGLPFRSLRVAEEIAA